ELLAVERRPDRLRSRSCRDGDGRALVHRLASRGLFGRRVAGWERLGERAVVVRLDAECPERLEKRLLRVRQRNAVLRPSWARERRLDVGEVELDHLRIRRMLARLVPQQVLPTVRLDERDAIGGTARQAEVLERQLVDGEE